MGEKRKNKDRLCTILMIVFFSILAILVILPIYTIFLASFKPGGDLLQYGLNLGIDWSRMSLDNYVLLFTGQHDYWRWFFNSITLTVVTVVATLLVSAFVGYGFAAYEFKGKNFMFVIVLIRCTCIYNLLLQTVSSGTSEVTSGSRTNRRSNRIWYLLQADHADHETGICSYGDLKWYECME